MDLPEGQQRQQKRPSQRYEALQVSYLSQQGTAFEGLRTFNTPMEATHVYSRAISQPSRHDPTSRTASRDLMDTSPKQLDMRSWAEHCLCDEWVY